MNSPSSDPMAAALADARWIREGHLSLRRLGLRELPAVLDLDELIAGTRTLDLAGNRLETLPDWIWQLEYLERLLLGGNRLRQIDDGIGDLAKLSALDVSANRLTGVPESLAECLALRLVDMSGNAITDLGALVRLPSLVVLDLADNRLSSMARVPSAGSLQILDLSNNELTELPWELPSLHRLRSLDLSANRLVTVPTGDLTDVPLEELYVDDNFLSAAPDRGPLPRLTRLSMVGNPGLDTAGTLSNDVAAELTARLVDPGDPDRRYFDTSTKRLDASLIVDRTGDLRRVVRLYYKGVTQSRTSIIFADGAQLALDGVNRSSALDFVNVHHAAGTDAVIGVAPDKRAGALSAGIGFLARAAARLDASRVRLTEGTDVLDVQQDPVASAPRVVNVAVTDVDGAVLGPTAGVGSRTRYLARINIGPELTDTIVADPVTISPDDLVADGHDGYWFDVAVSSAGVEIAPDLHRLFLPFDGASWVCSCVGRDHTCTPGQREPFLFVSFHTRDAGPVALRCTIYNANNAIQSARIDMLVVVDAAASGKISGEIDFALSDDAGAAGQLPPRRLNVMTNHAPDGTHTLVIKGEDRSIQVDIGELAASKMTTEIRDKLLLITLGKDGKTSQYDSANRKRFDAFVEDLAELALLGWQLWSGIVSVRADSDYLYQHLVRRSTIQITRVTRTMFPWALVYDIPRAVSVAWTRCPLLQDWSSFDAALAAYPDICPHSADHDVNVLCPYGFWGFRHLVEQPPSIRVGTLRDRIPVSGPARATAGRSLALDRTLTDAHFRDLNGIFSGDVTLQTCDSKTALQTAFANPALPIVYLYCHGRLAELAGTNIHVPCIQVGKDDLVAASDFAVWQRADEWDSAHWLPTGPLVFINGCETARIELDDLVSFVDKLAGWDAAGVIGTEIPVHQRVAGAVALGFYRHFAATPAVSAGMALHRSRIDLLRLGNVAGLAYTAFCSVDLTLERV